MVGAAASLLALQPGSAQESASAEPADSTAAVAVDSAGSPAPQPQQQRTDAWGAERNFGLAVAEMLMGNFVPWFYNEFPRQSDISQMNPASWWHNLQEGMGWDDNNFSTNQFAHPFQGNLYFNAFRGNGYNFWESAPWAFVGSFLWECCGETHLMSVNDFMNTGLGGIALGEMLYRTSSMVLDNTARGGERNWREIGAFALNPVRGVNRALTGRWGKVYDNPADRRDHYPISLANRLAGGYRAYAENAGFTDPQSAGFLDMDFLYGGPMAIERNRPYEFFLLGAQVNFSDKQALGRLQVSANLYHRDLSQTSRSRNRFMVLQNFDYINNKAFEFGGQSVSGAFLSSRQLGESGNWGLFTSIEGYVMLIAAVNSDFAFVAEIPGVRERLREYDFGPGVGARGVMSVLRGRERILDVTYRATYINTVNGSVTNGSDAWHVVHMAGVKVLVPVSEMWGIGADWKLFLRNSYYSPEEFEDTVQRSPQVRLYVSWKVGESGPAGVGMGS